MTISKKGDSAAEPAHFSTDVKAVSKSDQQRRWRPWPRQRRRPDSPQGAKLESATTFTRVSGAVTLEAKDPNQRAAREEHNLAYQRQGERADR